VPRRGTAGGRDQFSGQRSLVSREKRTQHSGPSRRM
jgi:hypothetical protein